MKLKILKKQYVLLLEVVIALMLVALCAIPLLAPQAYLLSRQQKFINEVDLDHLVNLLYADIVLQLYRNEIPWESLINETSFEITPEMISRTGFSKKLPFKGTYAFPKKFRKQKPKKESPFTIFLLPLLFTFSHENNATERKDLKYEYKVFLIRHIETDAVEIIDSDVMEEEEEPEGSVDL